MVRIVLRDTDTSSRYRFSLRPHLRSSSDSSSAGCARFGAVSSFDGGCGPAMAASRPPRSCGSDIAATKNRAQCDHTPGRPDRSFGVQQAANSQETRGSRVQTENAERLLRVSGGHDPRAEESAATPPGFNPGCLPERHGEIVASILAQPMNDPIRGPDDGIEKVQDGRALLQPDDHEIEPPDMCQFMEQPSVAALPSGPWQSPGARRSSAAHPPDGRGPMPSHSTIRTIWRTPATRQSSRRSMSNRVSSSADRC